MLRNLRAERPTGRPAAVPAPRLDERVPLDAKFGLSQGLKRKFRLTSLHPLVQPRRLLFCRLRYYGCVDLSITSFLIVCPLCLFVGVMNASVGGGGLISLPAMLLAGLPPHVAIGTNKLQAICGLSVATYRYAKSGLIEVKLAIPTIVCALLGSFAGSNCSLLVSEDILKYIVVLVLPIVAFLVFRKDSFMDDSQVDLVLNRRTYITACASSLVIGFYDGFYGPGAGTFFVIAFCVIAQLGARRASAHAKVVNLTTNLTATVVFLLNGQVCVPLGLAAGVCAMIGAWLGAGLVIKDGARIMKPLIAVAFVLLVVKLVGGF